MHCTTSHINIDWKMTSQELQKIQILQIITEILIE